jgi:recombinational DNA repair protein (RecF pathway)
VMQNDPSGAAPAEPEGKRCAACYETKSADQFYVSRGRLSAYCKTCQRAASAAAYRRRRSEPTERARMRALDRQRQRAERARLARTDSNRERRDSRVRTAAVRRLIGAHQSEYRAFLQDERRRREGRDD